MWRLSIGTVHKLCHTNGGRGGIRGTPRIESGGQEMVDLTHKMLAFDPSQRIDCTGCLQHPYMASLHCPEDEPEGEPLGPEEFAFEKDEEMDEKRLRALIMEEICHHNPREEGGRGVKVGGGAGGAEEGEGGEGGVEKIEKGMAQMSVKHK